MSRIRRGIRVLFGLTVGTLLCQGLLASIVVVGWVTRVCRRAMVLEWMRCCALRESGVQQGQSSLVDRRDVREWIDFPGWINGASSDGGLVTHRGRWIGGLVTNVRIGLQILLNTWIYTLPGCLFWTFAWYDGWQNSFNKGYEQAWVGPTLFAIGTILFVAGMYYVPMAQARQAATGDWRSFHQFSLVWKLVRRSSVAGLGLAVLCFGLTIPILTLRSLPAFFPQIAEDQARKAGRENRHATSGISQREEWSPVEMRQWMRRYSLAMGVYVFSSLVLLRMLAAKVYARTLRKALQEGVLRESDLGDFEALVFRRLGIVSSVGPKADESGVVRSMVRAWRSLMGLACLVATAFVWLAFTVGVMTGEFVKHSKGGRNWWNQSLIHLPWTDVMPQGLKR